MGSGPKGKRIAQGYKTRGLEVMDSSWLRGSGPKKKDSSGLAGSGPKGKRIAQGYKTQGLEEMDSSGLRGSGPKKRIAQGY